MSVLLQNNSVLKSIGGEVYKQPPLIDISSTYGVTKDGSNLVSSVKNRNTANKLRLVSGNGAIEDGDGFLFSSDLYQMPRCNFDWSKDFTFEMWVKPINLATEIPITILDDFTGGSFTVGLFVRTGTLRVEMTILTTSGGGQNTLTIPANMNAWNHYIMTVKQTYCMSCYLNGYVDQSINDISYLLGGAENDRFRLGSYYQGSNAFTGRINSIKFSQYNIPYLNNRSGIYTQGTQVFTPPTYPNTIL